MKSFKKYMESFESEMTGSNIVMICNNLKNNGSNPSDAGYLVVADILESLGNEFKADTIRMVMNSSYAEKAAKLIAESGSKGFVSLDGLMGSREQRATDPYADLAMNVDKVANVKEILERDYPFLKDSLTLKCEFHFSDTVFGAAIEKHMSVEQYLIGKNLNSESFHFMHPRWGRMMRINDEYAVIHDGYETILDAFRDNCGTDAVVVRRYSDGRFAVNSDMESYVKLVATHDRLLRLLQGSAD